MSEKKYLITGTFKVIFKDEDEENAIMQCMENYLAGVQDDCDEWFEKVEFEFADCEEVN